MAFVYNPSERLIALHPEQWGCSIAILKLLSLLILCHRCGYSLTSYCMDSFDKADYLNINHASARILSFFIYNINSYVFDYSYSETKNVIKIRLRCLLDLWGQFWLSPPYFMIYFDSWLLRCEKFKIVIEIGLLGLLHPT